MKKPVNDALVAEYTKQLRTGGPVGAVFPQPVSECDFNEAQKFLIKEARKARKQLAKQSKPQPTTPHQSQPRPVAVKPTAPPPSKPKPAAAKPAATVRAQISRAQSLSLIEQILYPAPPKTAFPKPVAPKPKPVAPVQAPASQSKSLNKLEKMLYLQQGKCFFCGEKLALAEANIEHLYPVSMGGKNTPDNLVVCHRSLNDTFGDLPLKQKFEFVLKAAGSFRCPKK